MSDAYLNKLEIVLRKDERLVAENGRLLKVKIAEVARALDPELIKLLLNEKELKKLFFTQVDSVLVFNKDKFVAFVENEAFLPDSYTAYKNKIGLATDRNDFISDRNEVVLNWPYKDCVLEGGQDKEDQKRNEIFWNDVLGADQRDVLLAPKVLTGFKRYDKDGEHNITEIKENENLIIKGNNLLTLFTLKKRYSGKVKLIYIDPPYNTGNDGFNYNDNFNHSSWLVFMKNRLEIAKQLLSDDGLIFVQADYNEAHYLKVLLDEVFGRDKFINEIIWKRKFGTANETRRFATAFDNIYLYSKTNNYKINLIKEKYSKHVQEYIKSRFTRKDKSGPHTGRLWMPYPLANPGAATKNLSYEYKGYTAPPKGWRMTKNALEKMDKEGRLYFPENKSQRMQEKKFLDEYDGQPVDTLWTDIYVINSQSGEALDFDGQKPEDLLRRIILIGTDPGEIVLDFFIGSGTTCAVAHKMGRQYIGVEQLYYGETDSLERLQKVIKGDQSGISKIVGWKGGGSFVSAHLKNDVNVFIEEVNNAKTNKELLDLLHTVKTSNFLSYRVDLEKLHEDEFEKLPEEQKKRLLIELVDKNKLYVNYHDIDDENYKIDTNTKKLNHWLQTRNRE